MLWSDTNWNLEVKPADMRSFNPLEAIVFIVGHMDRLARQHDVYGLSSIVDLTMPHQSAGRPAGLHFTVDSRPQVLQFFYSVLSHAIQLMNDTIQFEMSYVIVACLRLLKVNIHEIVVSSTSLGMDPVLLLHHHFSSFSNFFG